MSVRNYIKETGVGKKNEVTLTGARGHGGTLTRCHGSAVAVPQVKGWYRWAEASLALGSPAWSKAEKLQQLACNSQTEIAASSFPLSSPSHAFRRNHKNIES